MRAFFWRYDVLRNCIFHHWSAKKTSKTTCNDMLQMMSRTNSENVHVKADKKISTDPKACHNGPNNVQKKHLCNCLLFLATFAGSIETFITNHFGRLGNIFGELCLYLGHAHVLPFSQQPHLVPVVVKHLPCSCQALAMPLAPWPSTHLPETCWAVSPVPLPIALDFWLFILIGLSFGVLK